MKRLSTEQKKELIEEVIKWIQKDIEDEDVTCVEELLKSCPTKNLVAYLPRYDKKKWDEIFDKLK